MLSIFIAVFLFFFVAHADIVTKCQRSGMFAMTWDDGPADFTSQLLDILSKKQVKTTFHLSTQHLTDPNVQSMVQRIAGEGHLIGLRTEPDWNMFQMSDDMIKAVIARAGNTLANFSRHYPKFIRLPYKGWDDRVRRAVEETGAIITQHNIESYDYTGNADRIYNSFQLAVSLKAPGSGNFISVQRDSIQGSVGVTSKLIDLIKENGYEIVTLDKCIGLADMTKNKEPLKGADGVKLPPMPGSDGAPAGSASKGGFEGSSGSGPSSPFGGPMGGSAKGGKDGKLGKASKNSAHKVSGTCAIAVAVGMALVLVV